VPPNCVNGALWWPTVIAPMSVITHDVSVLPCLGPVLSSAGLTLRRLVVVERSVQHVKRGHRPNRRGRPRSALLSPLHSFLTQHAVLRPRHRAATERRADGRGPFRPDPPAPLL